MALPGRYQIRLTVDGRSLTAPLELKMDPRVSVSEAALNAQLALATKISDAIARSSQAFRQLQDLRKQLTDLQSRLRGRSDAAEILDAAKSLESGIAALEGGGEGLAGLNAGLAGLMVMVTSADAAPTAQMAKAFAEYDSSIDRQIASWTSLRDADLKLLNRKLELAKLPALKP